MATKMELHRSPLTNSMYVVTKWTKKPTDNQAGIAAIKHDVTDSFRQEARIEMEYFYKAARELFTSYISAAEQAGATDEQIARDLESMRKQLIFFGDPADVLDLQAEDWIERVRKWS